MKINRTTKRAIDILELVAQQPKGITLNEIAKVLKMPTTSAFDIVHTLKQEGMLELDPYSKLYSLGPKSLLIGQQYLKSNDLIQIAKPYMIDLAEKLSKTCFLAKEVDDQVLYINKYEPLNAVITMANIGSRTYMHATALGKALLSTYEKFEEKVSKLKLVKLTPNTITDKDQLIKELNMIKARGYSVDNEEVEENMLCIGAPIYDHNNQCVAAISVSSIKRGQIDIEYEGNLVKSVALAISRKLGYHE